MICKFCFHRILFYQKLYKFKPAIPEIDQIKIKSHLLTTFLLQKLNQATFIIFVWKLSRLQLGMYQHPINPDLIGRHPTNLGHHLRTRNSSLNGILQFLNAVCVPSGAAVLNADLNHLPVFPLCLALSTSTCLLVMTGLVTSEPAGCTKVSWVVRWEKQVL